MKSVIKKLLICLLSATVLLGTAACTTPGGDRETTPDGTTATGTPGDTSPDGETSGTPETEGETVYRPEDYEVTVDGDTASVLTPMGLAYTVSGYDSLDKATATFTEGLTYTFAEEAFDVKFNRFTMTYDSTEPLKVWLSYHERGREVEEYFFLEAGKTTFSGLNTGYLAGYSARKLVSIKVETCTGKACDFTLTGISVQKLDKVSDTFYIANDRFKLGVEVAWGGTVSYLEDKNCTIPDLCNLVNKHDTGRLIQQSFYGVQENEEYTPGTSFDTKWRYNPVQGGDQFNNASRLIDLVISENSIYIKAQPQDWALDNQLTPSYMENTYTLYEDRVQVDNRFTDFSGWEHPFAGQELPAFYTVSYLDTFVWYNGEKPWTGDALTSKNDLPFWGDYASVCTFSLREKNTETWCAWINGADNYGLGVYAPNIDQHKAGRYLFDGSKSDVAESTGYVAPINILKMVSFKPIEYSYLLTAGSTEDIREVFTAYKDFTDNKTLHENYQSCRIPSVDGDITALDFTQGKNIALLTQPVSTEVTYDADAKAAKLTAGPFGDSSVTIHYDSASPALDASKYTTLRIEYMIPKSNSTSAYQSDIFLCAGEILAADGNARLRVNLIADGEYHVLEVKLSSNAYWKGDVHAIRFDYFDNCAEGDVMYVKNISLK